MFALVRKDEKVGWVDVPRPDLGRAEVRISPRLVGICRTDLAVASGRRRVGEPRILGHEFVGEVTEVGEEVRNCAVGDSVAVDPTIACGACHHCTDGWAHACADRKFMGIDCDGALSESVVVPARNVWVMPYGMGDARAAMLEPVAACAAVLKVPIDPDDRGLINGVGRSTQLTRHILAENGIVFVDRADEVGNDSRSYDFAVDTMGSTASIEYLLERLRPGGSLILKSRPAQPASVAIREILPKEPVIHAVNYASFFEARRLLVDQELDIEALLGPTWAAENFAQAFQAAKEDGRKTHFLAFPVDEHSRDSFRQNLGILATPL